MAIHSRKKVLAKADALDILGSWTKDDPAIQQMIAEERSYAAVARQIYALRKARGLTQRELAELVGTKQPVIARLEDSDYQGHSLAMLSRIGAALGCAVSVAFVPPTPSTARRRTGTEPKSRAKSRKRSAA